MDLKWVFCINIKDIQEYKFLPSTENIIIMCYKFTITYELFSFMYFYGFIFSFVVGELTFSTLLDNS